MDRLQPMLLDLPEQTAPSKTPIPIGQIKLQTVERQQTKMLNLCVDDLIPIDHKARAIWALVGKLNLSAFTEPLRTQKGCAGRAAWDPQLLVSVWVYAYCLGISSAREVSRLMQWEPGLQWLGGLEEINYHTLASFRVDHKEALDGLFVQLLATLESAGLLDLEQIMHDGTKIRAQAGADTFRRKKTVEERLKRAREAVEQMADPDDEQTCHKRRKAAQERAAREQAEILEAALKELQEIEKSKPSEAEQQAARVSVTEPQARLMKHGDNAIAPSYNAQISTDAANKIIVGAHLSQSSSDAQSLMPGIEEVVGNLGRKPEQVVVDGGFTNRDNILQCATREIDLVGPLPDPLERSRAAMKSLGIAPEFAPSEFRILNDGESLECPAGCRLDRFKKKTSRGDLYQLYRARGADCQSCRYQAQCCPRKPQKGREVSIRIKERADMAAFRQKMATEEYRATYRKRGEVAEFPNAWIKDKLGLEKFRVRGLAKAGSELIWACLTYNIMQWIRLVWRPTVTA